MQTIARHLSLQSDLFQKVLVLYSTLHLHQKFLYIYFTSSLTHTAFFQITTVFSIQENDVITRVIIQAMRSRVLQPCTSTKAH